MIAIIIIILVAICFVGYLMAQFEEGRTAAEHRAERKRRKRQRS